MPTRTNYRHSEFVDIIINKINEFSEKKPTYWGNGSIAKAFVTAQAYFNELIQLQVNIVWSSFRIKTARGIHLDNRAGDFDIFRNSATSAIAIERFNGDAGRIVNINIPLGTTVSTEVDQFGNTIDYTLNDNLTLSSGSAYVTGLVTCTIPGSIGNVQSGKIIRLPTPIIGVSGVTNIEDISNGVEDETDEELRSRIAAGVNGLAKGNKDAVEFAIYSVEGITFVKLLGNSPAPGNIAIVVNSESGVVDSVLLARIGVAAESAIAFPITHSIIIPTQEYILLSMEVEIDTDIYQQLPMTELIQTTIKNFINKKKISKLNISDINHEVRKISGILNVKNILINGDSDDLLLDDLFVIKISDESDISITYI